MTDKVDRKLILKLVEEQILEEGVFGDIGKYFSDIWKAGQNAAADPERYWKEKQQRHWTHGDGTKQTEQPPEPPAEADDKLPPATFIDVENMEKFVKLMGDAVSINKKLTVNIPAFDAWTAFFESLGQAVEKKLGVAKARHDPNELGDASYFQAPEGEEQQQINENINQGRFERYLKKEFKRVAEKKISPLNAAKRMVKVYEKRGRDSIAYALWKYVTDPGSRYNYKQANTQLNTTDYLFLASVDPESFEQELSQYFLHGNKDMSMVKRKAEKTVLDLAKAESGAITEKSIIFHLFAKAAAGVYGKSKAQSNALRKYLAQTYWTEEMTTNWDRLIDGKKPLKPGEEEEEGAEAAGEEESTASEEEVETARDGLRGLLGLDDDGNPDVPGKQEKPIDQKRIDQARELQEKGEKSLALMMQMGEIVKNALEASAELSKTEDFKSLNAQFPPFIKFMIKQEDTLTREMATWKAILDTLKDAPEEEPETMEEPEKTEEPEQKKERPKTNPFAGPMNENIKVLKSLGFTDQQIQHLVMEEFDAILLDEGMRDEFIKSLKGSAIALGLASCIGAGCDVAPQVQSQIDHEETAIVLHVNNKLGSDVRLELNGVPIGDYMVGECELQNNEQCSSTFSGEASYNQAPDGETKRCGMTSRGPDGFTECDETVRTILVEPGEYLLTVRGPGHLEPFTKEWGGSRRRGQDEKLTEKTIDISQGVGVDNAKELVIKYDFVEFPSKRTGYQAVITADIVE